MFAAQLQEESLCGVILDSDRSHEMISNECRGSMVNSTHFSSHTTDSTPMFSSKSEHAHAFPVVNREKPMNSHFPKENAIQNLPSPNCLEGKEEMIKTRKFSLIGTGAVGPEGLVLGGKLPNAPLVDTSSDVFSAPSDCSSERTLFWTPVVVQSKSLFGLVDSGSCRNLISDLLWEFLPQKPALIPPGHTLVVAGDGRSLDLLGCCVLKFDVVGKSVLHEVSVVKGLPVDFIIGGELMKCHNSSITYQNKGRNIFKLGSDSCIVCDTNHELLKRQDSVLLNITFEHKVPFKPKSIVSVMSNVPNPSEEQENSGLDFDMDSHSQLHTCLSNRVPNKWQIQST